MLWELIGVCPLFSVREEKSNKDLRAVEFSNSEAVDGISSIYCSFSLLISAVSFIIGGVLQQ